MSTPKRSAAAFSLTLFTLLNLVNYADRYVLAGALPLVQGEFQRSDEQMGVLAMSFLLVFSFASPLAGVLGDRLPRRGLIGGGIVLWSLATIWSGRARGYEELLLARAAIGVGEAAYGAIVPGYVADLFSLKRRGAALAVFYTAIPLGVGVGFALGGAIGEAYGWRTAFFVAGVPGLALGLMAFFLPEPVRGATDLTKAIGEAPRLREIASALARRRSYLVNTLAFTAMSFATGGLGAWMPTFLHRVRGVPLGTAGQIFGAMMIVSGVTATLAGGWLGERAQRRSADGYFTFSGVALVLAFPCAAGAVLLQAPALFWPSLFCSLFFLFLNNGPLNAALVNVVPAAMRSTAVAMNVLVTHLLGDALAPWAIGAVSDRTSLALALGVACLAIAAAGGALIVGRGALLEDLGAKAPSEGSEGRLVGAAGPSAQV